MEEPNVRFPNNWQGWAKVFATAAVTTFGSYTLGANWKITGFIFLTNLVSLFTHTPANTALSPGQLRARAIVQAQG